MITKMYNDKIHADEIINLINTILPTAANKVATYKEVSKHFHISLSEFGSAWNQTKEALRASLFIRTHGGGWVWPKWVKSYL